MRRERRERRESGDRSVKVGVAGLVAVAILLAGCSADGNSPGPSAADRGRTQIVVSHPILGAVVTALAGDQADVSVLMGPGVDPHDYRPSAREAATLGSADLVVLNGLGLEEGLDDAVTSAQARGVRVFRATDHVDIRRYGEGELPASESGVDGDVHGDAQGDDAHGHEDEASAGGQSEAATGGDHGLGAPDPHFWLDPLAMKQVVTALAGTLQSEVGLDVTARAAELGRQLDELDAEIRSILEVVPADRRLLVTGHESMGYFARRYGFELVGAVIPSGSSQAAPSASRLAGLGEQIRRLGVRAVFTEIGTPPDVARAVAEETGAELVELPTHTLPADGSYRSFMIEVARAVALGLGSTSGPR